MKATPINASRIFEYSIQNFSAISSIYGVGFEVNKYDNSPSLTDSLCLLYSDYL
jgi:hypothetical protein